MTKQELVGSKWVNEKGDVFMVCERGSIVQVIRIAGPKNVGKCIGRGPHELVYKFVATMYKRHNPIFAAQYYSRRLN